MSWRDAIDPRDDDPDRYPVDGEAGLAILHAARQRERLRREREAAADDWNGT